MISPLLFLLHLFDSSHFSFLLNWLVVYSVDLFKNELLDLLIFLKGFFVSLSPSVLILVISCLLVAFEFCLFVFLFYLATLALSIFMIGC